MFIFAITFTFDTFTKVVFYWVNFTWVIFYQGIFTFTQVWKLGTFSTTAQTTTLSPKAPGMVHSLMTNHKVIGVTQWRGGLALVPNSCNYQTHTNYYWSPLRSGDNRAFPTYYESCSQWVLIHLWRGPEGLAQIPDERYANIGTELEWECMRLLWMTFSAWHGDGVGVFVWVCVCVCV